MSLFLFVFFPLSQGQQSRGHHLKKIDKINLFSSTQGPRGTKRALTEVLQQQQPQPKPEPVENPREKRLVLLQPILLEYIIIFPSCI